MNCSTRNMGYIILSVVVWAGRCSGSAQREWLQIEWALMGSGSLRSPEASSLGFRYFVVRLHEQGQIAFGDSPGNERTSAHLLLVRPRSV